MDRSSVAYLVTEGRFQNPDLTWGSVQKQRKVYVNITSVTGSEWFEGSRVGLNPEKRVTMFLGDYKGEQLIIIGDVTYRVYRYYMNRNDEIELYVEKRSG